MRKQARAKKDARVLKDINCLSCGGLGWSQRDRATHNNSDTQKTYNTFPLEHLQNTKIPPGL